MADQITATERVREAISAGHPPGRKDIERALRESFGMSARKAKQFAAEGAKALGAQEPPELEAVIDRLAALERSLRL